MISFKLFLENQRRLQERLTISLDLSDPIEKNFKSSLDKDYDFADNIIRWYRNSKKEGMSSSELTSIYKTNLDNLIDLLNDYKDCIKKIRSAGKKSLTVSIKTRKGSNQSFGIDDLDKFNFLDIAQNFIKAVCDEAAKLSTVSTGKAKYQITNEDAKKIYLLDFSKNVALWVTEGPDRDTTNKLVYQLWNNVEDADSKMNRGDVWGNPKEFSPYCTHSENHWKSYSKKAYNNDPKNYKQFWYLKKIPEANYVKGDLTNKNVQKIFEKMSGTGADTIICMNDSINEMLDRYDKKVEDISKLEFSNEIKDLQDKNFEKANDRRYKFKDGTYTFSSKLYKEFLFLKDQVPSELLNDINEKDILPEVVEGSIRINSSVAFETFLKYSKNLKTVTGDFTCAHCTSLESLEGAPEKVGGDFICVDCDSLDSLEGAPEKVSGDFICAGCTSLESLEGAPKEVGEDFICDRCHSLKSLEGAPEKVGGDFNCYFCKSLKSLEGAPEKIGGDFICSGCTSLESLEGAPKEVGEDFICDRCHSLKSLEGAPKKVSGDFKCANCKSLKTLEGAPKEIGGDFICSGCESLKTLEGAPEKVGGKFDCSRCDSLTSYKGKPKHIGQFISNSYY